MALRKTCGNCGREVSVFSRAGQNCPHCGARWSYEKTILEKIFDKNHWQFWKDAEGFTAEDVSPLVQLLLLLLFGVFFHVFVVGAIYNAARNSRVETGEGPIFIGANVVEWYTLSGRGVFLHGIWWTGIVACPLVAIAIIAACPNASINGVRVWSFRPAAAALMIVCTVVLLLTFPMIPKERHGRFALSPEGFVVPDRTIAWNDLRTIEFIRGTSSKPDAPDPLKIKVTFTSGTNETFDAPSAMQSPHLTRASRDDFNWRVWLERLPTLAPHIRLESTAPGRRTETEVIFGSAAPPS